jgi:type II secretory pathway component PulM
MAGAVPVGNQERLAQWWVLRSPRERFVLVLLACIAGIALLWLLLWQPLERDRERLARQLAEQRSALAEARKEADEIAGLARNAPASPAGEPRAAIESALARQGLKPVGGSIERLDGDRWRISLDAVAFDTLIAWLDTLQRDAGMRAAEVSVTARVEPGLVRADVTLARR